MTYPADPVDRWCPSVQPSGNEYLNLVAGRSAATGSGVGSVASLKTMVSPTCPTPGSTRNALSFAGWCQFPVSQSLLLYWGNSAANGVGGYTHYGDDNTLVLLRGGIAFSSGIGGLSPGTFYHVGFAMNNNFVLRMYVNGTIAVSSSASPNEGSPSSVFSPGNTDDIQVFNRVLTGAEFASLHSFGRGYLAVPLPTTPPANSTFSIGNPI